MQKQALYHERTGWAWWVHLLVGLTFFAAVPPIREFLRGNVGSGEGAMPVWGALVSLILGLGLPTSIYMFVGQLRTRVTKSGLDLSWGFSGVIRKSISLQDIERVKVVTYSPLREFGGWGIRIAGKKKRAWTTRGNRAVVFHLKDGTQFYLGSDTPDRIAQWVSSTMNRSR